MIAQLPIFVLAEGGGSNLLAPDGSLLFTIVLFLVLVPVLNRILFRPITHVLDRRDALTRGSETDTHAILNTVDENLTAYEEGVRDARSEGYKLIESRRALAMEERQALIDRAKGAAASKIGEARATIEAEASEARDRLATDAREIADQISTGLLGRAVGGK